MMKRQIRIKARVKLNNKCNHLISGYADTVAPFAFLRLALHFWNPSKPMQDTDAPVGQKGFTMSIHSTVVAVDCLDK
jgi:hypothetical protein